MAAALSFDEIAGLIVSPDLVELVPSDRSLIVSDDPLATAYSIHEYLCSIENFHWESFPTFIHPTAQVNPSAHVSERDVIIGANSIIGHGAIVLNRSIIEESCEIGPNAVIGAQAFESVKGLETHRLTKSAGGVYLHQHSNVGANTVIERAAFGGFTTIGPNALLSALIYVAHDAQVGANSTIAAGVAIGGRVKIESNCFVGIGSELRNGISIGAGARVSMGSVVTTDVAEREAVSGNFAVPHERWIKFVKGLGKCD